MHRAGAADVARAAGARAHSLGGVDGGGDHHRMPAHAQVVVGRPHQDLAAVRPAVIREPVRLLLERSELAVAALRPDRLKRMTAVTLEGIHAKGTFVRSLAWRDGPPPASCRTTCRRLQGNCPEPAIIDLDQRRRTAAMLRHVSLLAARAGEKKWDTGISSRLHRRLAGYRNGRTRCAARSMPGAAP